MTARHALAGAFLAALVAIGCSGIGSGPDLLNCYGGGEPPDGANLWNCTATFAGVYHRAGGGSPNAWIEGEES